MPMIIAKAQQEKQIITPWVPAMRLFGLLPLPLNAKLYKFFQYIWLTLIKAKSVHLRNILRNVFVII